MGKKNRNPYKGVPIDQRPRTYVEPRPVRDYGFEVTPVNDTPEEKEKARLMADLISYQLRQESAKVAQSQFFGRPAPIIHPVEESNKQNSKVHESYKPMEDGFGWKNEDGLVLQGAEINMAFAIKGFSIVHPDDPLALFKVRGIWYTPAEGDASLEKVLGVDDREEKYYDNGVDEMAYASVVGKQGSQRLTMQGLSAFVDTMKEEA